MLNVYDVMVAHNYNRQIRKEEWKEIYRDLRNTINKYNAVGDEAILIDLTWNHREKLAW